MIDFLRMTILEITNRTTKSCWKRDTDEIGDPTKHQNDEIIVDQPVVRSETTQIEEHPISLHRSSRVVRQLDRYMGIGDALVAISDDNKDYLLTLRDSIKDVDSKS